MSTDSKRKKKVTVARSSRVQPAVYGSFEAKTQLSRILKRVESGQQVGISRHGKVVAKVVPPGDVSTERPTRIVDVIAGIFALQEQVARNLGPKFSVRELRDIGRKE